MTMNATRDRTSERDEIRRGKLQRGEVLRLDASTRNGHDGGLLRVGRAQALAVLRLPMLNGTLERNRALPAGARIARAEREIVLLVERLLPPRGDASAIATGVLELALAITRSIAADNDIASDADITSLSMATGELASPTVAEIVELTDQDSHIKVRERADGKIALSIGDGELLTLESIRGGFALRSEPLGIAIPAEGPHRESAMEFLLQLSSRAFIRAELGSDEDPGAVILSTTIDSLARGTLSLAVAAARAGLDATRSIRALLTHPDLATWYLAAR